MSDFTDSQLLELSPGELYARYNKLANSQQALDEAKSHGLTTQDANNLFAYNAAKLILRRDPTAIEIVAGRAQLLYDTPYLQSVYSSEHPAPAADAPSNNPPVSSAMNDAGTSFTTIGTSSPPYSLFAPPVTTPIPGTRMPVLLAKTGAGGVWLLLGAILALCVVAFGWKIF